MITHAVLFKIRRDVPQADIDQLFRELASLQRKIPGIASFAGGPYASPEGLNRGFSHGFVMTFSDPAARDRYLTHPDHEVVKGHVLEVLDGGLDGAVAFDFES